MTELRKPYLGYIRPHAIATQGFQFGFLEALQPQL